MAIQLRCRQKIAEATHGLFMSIKGLIQAETPRQATQHDCLPCPGCWAMETTKSEKVCGEVNNILYWAGQINQGRTKNYCTGTSSPTNKPRKDPFHVYPKSPQLEQSACKLPSCRLEFKGRQIKNN